MTQISDAGYISKQETVVTIKAVVLPLTSEERKFWQEVGIRKASLKVFTDRELSTGWQIEIDGKRYTIRAYENYEKYRKAILEAVE
jgi:hypothetical protein